MSSRFDNRYDARTYANDEPVKVFVVEGTGIDSEFWLPERLWHRIRLVAAAFELHLLPAIDGRPDLVTLNWLQCESLLDELEFLSFALEDSLMDTIINGIVNIVESARGSHPAIGIEFP